MKRVLREDGTLWINIADSYAQSGKGGAGYTDNAMLYKQGTNKGTLSKCTLVKQETNCKPKDLIGIPWMLAFALRAEGWYWRDTIIWHKPNSMPESVRDRTTKAHEYILLFSKSRTYYFDYESIKQPAKLSTIRRVSQDVGNQIGSTHPLKKNGNMKAVIGGRKIRIPCIENLLIENMNILHLHTKDLYGKSVPLLLKVLILLYSPKS